MQALKILVCTNQRFNPKNPSCAAAGSVELLAQLKHKIQAQSLEVQVEEIKCFGQCEHAPVMRIAPGLDFYKKANSSELDMILERFLELNNNE